MDDLFINQQLTIPATDLSWSATRSSGPGGQHVNKSNSKVDLRFDLASCQVLTETQRSRLAKKLRNRLDADDRVVVTSQQSRTQTQNLDDARARLAELIRRGLIVPKKRRKTKPSRASKRRRLNAKKRRGDLKKTRKSVSGF